MNHYATIRDNPGLAWAAQEEAAALLKLKLAIEAAYKACEPTQDNIADYDCRMAVVDASLMLNGALSGLQEAIDDALARCDKHGGV